MAINKVVYGNSTLIDLTEDTVSANNLLAGETAHDRSGASVVGEVVIPEVVDNLTTQDATKALSANQGYVLNQNKVDKVTGKGLSTNDYTNEDKAKVTSSDSKITYYENSGYLGKNLWDEQWEVGGIDADTGQNNTATNYIRSTGYINVTSLSSVFLCFPTSNNRRMVVYWYDQNKAFISPRTIYTINEVVDVPSTAKYMRFYMTGEYGTVYNNDVSINQPTYTNYQPYVKSNIELDATKIDKTASEIQTSDGQFDTVTGGLMQSCVVGLEPIQSGSGVPSPSNVRAISGHTQVQVGNCGEDLCPNLESGTYNPGNGSKTAQANRARTNIKFFVKAGTYYLKFSTSAVGKSLRAWYLLWNSDAVTDNPYTYNSGWINSDSVVTINSDTYISLQFGYSDDSSLNVSDIEAKFALCYTTTINLGGTYYGGTLDAVSGKFKVTHKYIELTSSNQLGGFATSAQYGAYAYVNDTADCLATDSAKVYGLCSMCEYVAFDNRLTTANVNRVWSDKNNTKLFVRASASSNVSTLADLFAIFENAQIAYELATQFTIQLDPQTLETLVGQNDVFAPLVGQTVEKVEYREVLAFEDVEAYADTKADISAIAPVENGTTASQAYAIGEHFYRNGKFCTAITSISQGATFTLNTNYVEGDVASIIFENSWMELGSGSGILSQYYAISPECTTVNPIIFEGGWELKILTTMSYGINVLDILVRPTLQSVIVGFGKSDTEHHDVSFNFKVYGRKIQNSDEYFHEAPYIKLT